MHNGASRANRLCAFASVRTVVFYGAMLDSRSAAALAHRRPAVLAGRLSAVLARLLYAMPAAAIVTMVDPVANAGIADTLQARLADARKRHADGKYGTIPLLIVELGIRTQWATEHPTCPDSPRPVRSEGGVDNEVDGGARVNGNNGTKQRGVIKVDGGIDRSQARVQQSTTAAGSSRADVDGRHRSPLRSGGGLSAMTHVTTGGIAPTYGYFKFSPDRITVAPLQGRRDLIIWRESIEPQLEVAGLKGFADGTVPILPVDDVRLRGEFRAAHLLTFMVILSLFCFACSADYTPLWLWGKPSGGGRSTEDVDEKRSMRDKGRGGGGRRRECWICHDPDHLSYECLDRNDSEEDDTKGGRGRSTSRRPRRDAKPSKEKQTSTKDIDNSSGKSRGDGEASCSMVGVVEPTVSLAPEAGKDFQAVVATVQANPMAVLLNSGCSHHLMGTKAVIVDMAPSDGVKHVRGFNGALQPVEGRKTIALQGEARRRVLILNVLYVPGVQANLLSAGQLKESGVQLQGDGDEMLLVAATGEGLGQARYNGRVLCTDLCPCSTRSQSTEVVALRTIVSETKSTPDRLHARLAHVGVDTIKCSTKHKVATRLDITPSTGADPPCVSCVGGKLARHTFPAKGSNTEEALGVVHIDLCGPFRVASKDGSLYFLLLKDRHTRFVWVMPVTKKSDVLREFQKWLVLVERQSRKSVLMLCSDRGGEFLGKEFTDFVDNKGIVHDLTCLYTSQQNGMAEREMRTVVESVRTMLLHMGVQHHWWHLALRQAVWVRKCLERSTTPPGTTPYQLLTEKKPDLTLARVWGCMVQFMVLDLTDNKVVSSVEVIFYETLSLEVWKAKFGPASRRTRAHPPTDTSTATVPLLAEVDEHSDEDVVEVLPPPPVLAPPFPVADWPASTPVSATGAEGSLEALPVAPASGIAGGRQGAKLVNQGGKPVKQETASGVKSTGELTKSAESSKQLVDDLTVDEEGELSAGEESTDSDVVEVPITKPELRRTDPEHRWDIATMTVKEALASWKGEAVKAAMEEEIRNLVGMGTWELVERLSGVNIMKNQWVLTTKYRLDDTVEREKAGLVVKGFTQVCVADYDERYSPVSSYVTLRIFLSIVTVLDLNLMQLDMKKAFLQSKLDRVLYMY
ncbi:unnamed protein product [Closterium sp. NIES-53]